MRKTNKKLKYEIMKRPRYSPLYFKRARNLCEKISLYHKRILQLESIQKKNQGKSKADELEELKTKNAKLENKITYLTLMYSSRISELKNVETKLAEYKKKSITGANPCIHCNIEADDRAMKSYVDGNAHKSKSASLKDKYPGYVLDAAPIKHHYKHTQDLTEDKFYCSICDYEGEKSEYESHTETTYHMKCKTKKDKFVSSLNKKETNKDVDREISGEIAEIKKFKCEICQIETTDQSTLDLHMRGKKHISKENALYLELSASGNSCIGQYNCKICQIQTTDQSALEAHMRGKKHRAKQKNINDEIINGTCQNKAISKFLIVSDLQQMNNANSQFKKIQNNEIGNKKPIVVNENAYLSYMLYPGRDPNQSYTSEAGLRCLLCEVQCQTKSEFDSHIAGKRHKSKVKLEMNLKEFYANSNK